MDDSLLSQFGIGNRFMDQDVTRSKPQSMLLLDEINRKGGEHAQFQSHRLQELLKLLQQRYPNRSPMANYMHAYGLLQQEDQQEFQFSNASRKAKKALGQTY